MENLMGQLRGKDNPAAYWALKQLLAASADSDAVYAWFDEFVDLLGGGNSYIRTRGFLLITANLRWDAAHRVDAVLDRYLSCLADEKPTAARQCIQALPGAVEYRPDLAARLREALEAMDVARYAESVRPLLEKDIANALKKIETGLNEK